MNPIFVVLIAAAYTLVMVGIFRIVGAWLDWRDARRLSEFNAQCMVVEAMMLRRRGRAA